MKNLIYLWCIVCLYELIHFWPTKALQVLIEDEKDEQQKSVIGDLKSTNVIQSRKPVVGERNDDRVVLGMVNASRGDTLTLPRNESNSAPLVMPQYFERFNQDRLSFELKQFNHDQTWSERVILEIMFHSLKGEHWEK
jgi:hypothetical protein